MYKTTIYCKKGMKRKRNQCDLIFWHSAFKQRREKQADFIQLVGYWYSYSSYILEFFLNQA